MITYIKPAIMLTLCIFIPPLGWLFMYKYSTFDRKTNLILAVACLAFFIYANISAGTFENISGDGKGFEIRMTPEDFREKFNASAQKLAPNLDVKINEPLTVEDKNFSHEFSPRLKLVGTLNGEFISELKIFAEPENQDESFRVINVLGLLIATLNPELDAEDRGEVMRDLRMLKEVSAEGVYDWTTNRGMINYSVHNDSGKSIFTAEIK